MFGAAAPAAAEPGGDAWYRLRMCESGNNYRANTGNGYYGAYQFNAGTWHAYGGTGLPSSAPPAEQDSRARLLYRSRGWAPWPACSRRLGLRNDPAYGQPGAAPARAARAARPVPPRVTHRPARVLVTTGRSYHRRPGIGWPQRDAQPVGRPIRHRPARLALWSAPDGGRWGRPAGLLVPGSGHRVAAVRIPVAAFGYQPSRAGIVRPR
jgi:hypothetical protein